MAIRPLVLLGLFSCLTAHAAEEPAPLAVAPDVSQGQVTSAGMRTRLGELMAYARPRLVDLDGLRRAKMEEENAAREKSRARLVEIRGLEGKKDAFAKIAKLREEDQSDQTALKTLADGILAKQGQMMAELGAWNAELTAVAGSVVKGSGALESGVPLAGLKAQMQSGSVIYRWDATAAAGKPALEVKLNFTPLPDDIGKHFKNPTRRIGGSGLVLLENEAVAAVSFGKFLVEVNLKPGTAKQAPLVVASQVLDFDALGELKVPEEVGELAKLELPQSDPVEAKKPVPSLPRKEQQKKFAKIMKEMAAIQSKLADLRAKQKQEDLDRAARMEAAGSDLLLAQIDHLKKAAAAGEADAAKELAEAKKKLAGLIEKEGAPARLLGEQEEALLHEAELKNPAWSQVATSFLIEDPLAPEGVGLARVDADCTKGHLILSWDEQPGSHQAATSISLLVYPRPGNFQQQDSSLGAVGDNWPVIFDEPNNFRIWLPQLQVDVSVSPEWIAKGIKPRQVAESMLDMKALGELDAAAGLQ